MYLHIWDNVFPPGHPNYNAALMAELQRKSDTGETDVESGWATLPVLPKFGGRGSKHTEASTAIQPSITSSTATVAAGEKADVAMGNLLGSVAMDLERIETLEEVDDDDDVL